MSARDWGLTRPSAPARELVRDLEAAFRCLDAYEAMIRRPLRELEDALRAWTELPFSDRRYLQRVIRLKRTRRLTFERFWTAFFS